MNWLHDSRIDCYSSILTIPISDYLSLVGEAHGKRGGIAGQREVLKTTTARRIRDRMVEDIRTGALLPPVVVGIVEEPEAVEKIVDNEGLTDESFIKLLRPETLAIIDGMQRTSALLEAGEIEKGVHGEVRVDFWLAKSVRALVYRMLVLNTGQVPWTLARQLTVVYEPLLKEIKKNVPEIARILTPDKLGRRSGGAQFSSDALVELFIAFSLRKTNIDTRESLSEEFARLDLVANVADENVQGFFYRTLSSMASLDVAFDRLDVATGARFARGRDIFGSQPARIGYVAAVAQFVLGKVGLDRPDPERSRRMEEVATESSALAAGLSNKTEAEMADFLRLDVLSEVLDRKVGQVGRYERSVFFEAFRLLIEERFRVSNMEPCWRAN